MNHHSNNNIQNNWSALYKEINNNTRNSLSLKLEKQPKQISLLTRSLVRYIMDVAVIPYQSSELGLLVNKHDSKEYIAKKDKVLFLIKSEKSNSIIKPIFSKDNCILLESKNGVLDKFRISRNHIHSVNEYLLQLYKYLESNVHLIPKLKFIVPEQLANQIYCEMFIVNKKQNEKLFNLQNLINKVFSFAIDVKNAAYLSSYREVQWESIRKTLNKIEKIMNSLSDAEKLKIAFIIECLLKSKKFQYANIDNQIVFLRFLSNMKNKFLSSCSIFDNTKMLLENLKKQDIANIRKEEGDFSDKNSFYQQLINIKNQFIYDKADSINVQIFPVCVLNSKDGKIQEIETTVNNINENIDNSNYQDLCISQISNI